MMQVSGEIKSSSLSIRLFTQKKKINPSLSQAIRSVDIQPCMQQVMIVSKSTYVVAFCLVDSCRVAWYEAEEIISSVRNYFTPSLGREPVSPRFDEDVPNDAFYTYQNTVSSLSPS
mmetsp:Transcript_31310/g.46056  ORF Transcript_31310/g.46056 Transcript_31310/m.46056 type:complete len:116 (-) Transcript_31310:318-665(-)